VYQLDHHARHAELELDAFIERRRLERLAQGRDGDRRRRSFRLALGRSLIRIGRRLGGEIPGTPVLSG
jgi:hypothetical protein